MHQLQWQKLPFKIQILALSNTMKKTISALQTWQEANCKMSMETFLPVSYTHLRAHETKFMQYMKMGNCTFKVIQLQIKYFR